MYWWCGWYGCPDSESIYIARHLPWQSSSKDYKKKVEKYRSVTDSLDQNTIQTSLIQEILQQMLENTKIVVGSIPVNNVGSPLLDCSRNPTKMEQPRKTDNKYYTGCGQNSSGRVHSVKTSCQCNYPSISIRSPPPCEMYLLGSNYGNPSLALFISIINSLADKNERNRDLWIFRQQFMVHYSKYKNDQQHSATRNSSQDASQKAVMQSGYTFLNPIKNDDSEIQQQIDQIIKKNTETAETRVLEYVNKYNTDRAGGNLSANRMMLMPLTKVIPSVNMSKDNLYAEHDAVYSVGSTNEDISFEISVATKHSTTVTRYNFNETASLTEVMANIQYTYAHYKADSLFMQGWFQTLCEMAPMITGTNSSQKTGKVPWSELQFTMHQLLRAMGSFGSRGVQNSLQPEYDAVINAPNPSSSNPANARHQSCQNVTVNALASRSNNQFQYTEWPLRIIIGTSSTNTTQIQIRVPWSIPVYGVVVTSTPEIIYGYQLDLQVTPSKQNAQSSSVLDNTLAPDISRIVVWQCVLTVTKKISRSSHNQYGWNDTFPVFIGKNVRVKKVNNESYPISLFRGDPPLTPFLLTNHPPIKYTGVSDIAMIDWYPRLSMTSIHGINEDRNTMPILPAKDPHCFDQIINTVPSLQTSQSHTYCSASVFDRSLFDHRNAVLVIEPDDSPNGLKPFFNWLLDLSPDDKDDGSSRIPSDKERTLLMKNPEYKKTANSAVHLQQLTKSVKTLVLRLDEFDSNAFRQVVPTESDNLYTASLDTQSAQQKKVIEQAKHNYTQNITLLTRMYCALQVLYTNYVVVGIV